MNSKENNLLRSGWVRVSWNDRCFHWRSCLFGWLVRRRFSETLWRNGVSRSNGLHSLLSISSEDSKTKNVEKIKMRICNYVRCSLTLVVIIDRLDNEVDRGLDERVSTSVKRDRSIQQWNQNHSSFVCLFLLECCVGGFRVNGGGGTNVVRSSSFSSLLIGFSNGKGERSISLIYRDDSLIGCDWREIVTLIKPGWISRRTASWRIAAASKFDSLINDESLTTRIWSFDWRRLS